MDDLAEAYSRGSARTRSRSTTTYPGLDDFAAEEMTTIIPIDEYDTAIDSTTDHSWTPATWEPYYRPSRSEVTQDILIPEHEFDEYEYDEPLDFEGARPDILSDDPGRLAVETDDKPFRSNPQGSRTKRGGKHRVAAPPTALRGGRAALFAIAAGATVAAVTQVSNADEPNGTSVSPAANVSDTSATSDLGPGVAASTASPDTDGFGQQLAVGAAAAADEARREALARRPMFAQPVNFASGSCQFTSLYAMRWGSMHGGIDLACPLGTPIHAVTDGVVIAAEPASGYGNWVQIKAADGTVTMYGHMSSSGVLVRKGQHVTAGDVIALVGNEGFSTGPHLHLEVWKQGVTKIDPVPWLAAHGVRLPAYSG
ncbi:M23 family metallopeptidase [Gordonia sp. ABSL49_1]|uniref:M23 family metallopeptidase n=1 Tax=Gordonia sp. ABSL49_1 TaxID=2920941 RepID=UPI001F0CE680|nr:M23 family metallopeptidase [Gordonia sp. ABSL49_1]MCH5641835.1 M23 family metallopeptidase [Gordonia sp. ABSL49_1]